MATFFRCREDNDMTVCSATDNSFKNGFSQLTLGLVYSHTI